MAAKSDWEGALGAKWAARAVSVERLLSPFGAAAMAALGELSGRFVLDLGCGGGETTLELARRGAEALGVDVSPDLLALAERRRAAAAGPAAKARFLRADAAEAEFGRPLEAIFSQFGAMFFDRPAAAYAHIRAASAPGAPLAIACWRTPKENEWASLPLAAAKAHLPPVPPADRFAPGPFAWSEPEETFAPMLREAGCRDLAWRPLDIEFDLANGAEGDPVEAAMQFALEIGPLSSRLRDAPDAMREAATEAVRAALAARAKGGEVRVRAAGWIVTARA